MRLFSKLDADGFAIDRPTAVAILEFGDGALVRCGRDHVPGGRQADSTGAAEQQRWALGDETMVEASEVVVAPKAVAVTAAEVH